MAGGLRSGRRRLPDSFMEETIPDKLPGQVKGVPPAGGTAGALKSEALQEPDDKLGAQATPSGGGGAGPDPNRPPPNVDGP